MTMFCNLFIERPSYMYMTVMNAEQYVIDTFVEKLLVQSVNA